MKIRNSKYILLMGILFSTSFSFGIINGMDTRIDSGISRSPISADQIPSSPILDSIESPNTNGSVFLNWNEVSFAENYTLYMYSSFIVELNGSVNEIADDISLSEYNFETTTEGDYYFVVTANNNTGTSPISNCETVTVDLPPPVSPTLDPIDGPSVNGSFPLTWAPGDSFTDSYKLYRYSSPIIEINESLELIYSGSAEEFTDDLYESGTYHYAVLALNETGSSLSNSQSVIVNMADAPTLTAPTEESQVRKVSLTWNDLDWPDSYTIYRYSSFITEINGSLDELQTLNETEYVFYLASPGEFYFVIIAENSTHRSSASNCVAIMMDIDGLLDYDGSIRLSGSVSTKSEIYMCDSYPGGYCYCHSSSSHSASVTFTASRYSDTKIRIEYSTSGGRVTTTGYESYWTWYIELETKEHVYSSTATSGSWIVPESMMYKFSMEADYWYMTCYNMAYHQDKTTVDEAIFCYENIPTAPVVSDVHQFNEEITYESSSSVYYDCYTCFTLEDIPGNLTLEGSGATLRIALYFSIEQEAYQKFYLSGDEYDLNSDGDLVNVSVSLEWGESPLSRDNFSFIVSFETPGKVLNGINSSVHQFSYKDPYGDDEDDTPPPTDNGDEGGGIDGFSFIWVLSASIIACYKLIGAKRSKNSVELIDPTT